MPALISRASSPTPVEIIDTILDIALRHLSEEPDFICKRTALLDSVSKVGRAWRAAAQPRLFEYVTIRSQGGLHCLTDPRAGGMWAPRIRFLRIDFFWRGQTFNPGDHLSYQHQPKLAVLLNRLASLKYLRINGMRARVMTRGLVDSLSSLPHLESFELDCHGREHQIDSLLNSMVTWPRITTLKLSNMVCTPIKIHTPYTHSRPASSLRRLELYSVEMHPSSFVRFLHRLPDPILTHLALRIEPNLLPIIGGYLPRMGGPKLTHLYLDAGPQGFSTPQLLNILSRCRSLRVLEMNDRNIMNFTQFLSALPRTLLHLHVSANCIDLRGTRKALPPPSAIYTAFNERHVERALADLVLVPNLHTLVLDPVGWNERIRSKKIKDVDIILALEGACDRRGVELEWMEWDERAGF